MSSAFGTETVLDVRHWTDAYFSFTTTRDGAFRFDNRQFVNIGTGVETSLLELAKLLLVAMGSDLEPEYGPPRAIAAVPRRVAATGRSADAVGFRARGALTFEPAMDSALETPDLELLALAREVQAVVADRDTAALKQLLVLGGSPQGARPKALVQYDTAASAVSTRSDAPGTPWLVKFPGRHEHREVCAIEACYAWLAQACGLDMPRTRYFDLGPRHAAFGIERFDREDGMRVPMHSLAGALHADFRLPGVSYQTLLRATRLFTHSEREVEKAFERCVFNVVFHNRDDHAKNFSFRMDPTCSWKLAPCYDLSYSEGPGGEHQMDVEGEGRAPGRPHLMRLAASNSLDAAWAAATIDRFAAVAGEFRTICKAYAKRPATRQQMARAIEANRVRVA